MRVFRKSRASTRACQFKRTQSLEFVVIDEQWKLGLQTSTVCISLKQIHCTQLILNVYHNYHN